MIFRAEFIPEFWPSASLDRNTDSLIGRGDGGGNIFGVGVTVSAAQRR